MSQFTGAAATATEQAGVYTAALLDTLGSRDPFEVLRATPGAIRQTLSECSAAELAEPERPGKWSMHQLVQHLADSELVGAFRFRMILAHDRPPIQAYDQDLWADRLGYAEGDLRGAVEQFTVLRAANLRLLERTSPAERQRVGVHVERGDESIAHMIRMYAGHDLVHLRQLARIRRTVASAASSASQ